MVLNDCGQPWAIKWYRLPKGGIVREPRRERGYSFEEPHWSVYDDVVVLDREDDIYNKKSIMAFAMFLGVMLGWGGAKFGRLPRLGLKFA